MVIIKRYSNRKLYNPGTRSYITLDQLGGLVSEGQDVQVLEHPGGADLTAATLAQVILEQEKKMGGQLPNVFFTGLIQARIRTFQNLRESVHAFLDPDLHIEEDLQRRFRMLVVEKKITPALARRMESLLLDPRFRSTPPTEPSVEEIDIHLVDELRRQVDALEIEIDHLRQSDQGNRIPVPPMPLR